MNTSDEDLWFLPGPPQDMAPTDPPWAMAPLRPWTDPAAWHHNVSDCAPLLADAAAQLGRLQEALRHTPDGVLARLILGQVTEILRAEGARIGPERLALYRAGRLASGDDAQDLARANWAVRRLMRPVDPLADLPAFFDRRGGQGFAALATAWRTQLDSADLHPLLRSGYGFASWRALGETPAEDSLLEPAVLAMCMGAAPLCPVARLGRHTLLNLTPQTWLIGLRDSAQACLLEIDRLRAWAARAQTALRTLPGRTPARVVQAALAHTVLGVALAQAETGSARASCQRALGQLEKHGLLRECTGQARYRFWSATL